MARFGKGKSGNPRGRPVGSGTAARYRELLDAYVPALIDKAVELALAGDATALRLCLERVFPALKATEAPIQIDGLAGADGLTRQGRAVVNSLAVGSLPVGDVARAMQTVALQARIIEVDELEERVKALEAERHAQ